MAFPTTPLDVLAEVFVDGVPVDIATSLRTEDGAAGVSIVRGQGNERSAPTPSRATFALVDPDGTFNTNNPASAYYGKLGRGARLRLAVQPHHTTGPTSDVTDSFTRSVSNGWGTSSSGHIWQEYGHGSAADYAVSGTEGTHSVAANSTFRSSLNQQVSAADWNIAVTWKVDQATGADLEPANIILRARSVDVTYLLARVRVTTANTVICELREVSGGSETSLTSATVAGLTHAGTGTPLRVRVRAMGEQVLMRVWVAASAEPETWDLNYTGVSILQPGWIAVRSGIAASNSNAKPVSFAYDNFEATPESPRFFGELVSLQPDWDPTGSLVTVDVEAAGALRRLTTGAKPLRSAIYRATVAASPVVYWPLDGGSESTAFLPAVGPVSCQFEGRGAGAILGAGQADIVPGADPVLRNTYQGVAGEDESTNITASLAPLGQSGTTWRVECVGRFPADPVDPGAAPMLFAFRTTGSLYYAEVHADDVSNGGVLQLTYTTSTGITTISSSVVVRDSATHQFRFDFAASGSDVALTVYIDGVSAWTPTISSLTCPFPSYLYVFDYEDVEPDARSSIGHFAMWPSHPTTTTADAALGYTGETAAARMERLCGEEGLSFFLTGNADQTATMGPQRTASIGELLGDCAAVDGGILHEPRHSYGVGYRTRVSLYNQTPALELAYSDRHLAAGFRPVEDDLALANDVTASRIDGGSARYAIPDGDFFHYTTEQAPAGIGVVEGSTPDLNLASDGDLNEQAAWAAHVGAWKEQRFPSVSVNLAKSTYAADPTPSAAAAAVDVGDLVRVGTAGAPAWVPADEVLLMAQGYSERLAPYAWTLSWNTTPYLPWEVWQLDTGGSTLAVAVDDNDTSLKLATSSGPAWSTTDEPYHIQSAGQAMTVSSMTTDTPAFIAAGTVSHANNASVSPALPAGITADTGQLLLIWAAIRNSGTGTVDTPSGWTLIKAFGNTALFGRYYVTGVTAPTITFTGGAANADTSAQMAAFSGLSLHIGSSETSSYASSTPGGAGQLNSSAQDIATPGVYVNRDKCVVLWLGWKQDDWTSVATLAAADAEIGEPDTTTGDDQGIVWDYKIQSTGTDVSASSFTVTGGASAISRAVTLALRPLQTATVTRSVNGVTGSIAAGEAVHGWRLGAAAL